MYLLKLALRPWRLALASQFVAAFSMGTLLFLVALMFWMERSMRPILHRMSAEQVITAYLADEVPEKDEARIADEIRVSLGAKAQVKAVGVRDFLDLMRERYPALTGELESLGPEAGSVVPRYVSVTGVLPDSAAEEIRKVQGIESAESSKERYSQVFAAYSAMRNTAVLLGAALILALFAGLIQLSRLNAQLHRETVSLLCLLGAGVFAQRMPGMISGAFSGLTGGLVAGVAWLTGAVWLAARIRSLSPLLADLGTPGPVVGAALLLAGVLIGVLAGFFYGNPRGSATEVRG